MKLTFALLAVAAASNTWTFTSPNNGEFQMFYYNLPQHVYANQLTLNGPGQNCYAHAHGSYMPDLQIYACNRMDGTSMGTYKYGSAGSTDSTTSTGSASSQPHQSYVGTKWQIAGCELAYSSMIHGNHYIRPSDSLTGTFTAMHLTTIVVRTSYATQWSFHSCSGTWTLNVQTTAAVPVPSPGCSANTVSSGSFASPNNGEYQQFYYNLPSRQTSITGMDISMDGTNCFAHPHGSYMPNLEIYACDRNGGAAGSFHGSWGSSSWTYWTSQSASSQPHPSYVGTEWQIQGCTLSYSKMIHGNLYLNQLGTMSGSFPETAVTTILVRTCHATRWSFHSCSGNYHYSLKGSCATPAPTNYPTPSPTNYPTPSPTNYPTPAQCTDTWCQMNNGFTDVYTKKTNRGNGQFTEKWHCMNTGSGCKCFCDPAHSQKCTITHNGVDNHHC